MKLIALTIALVLVITTAAQDSDIVCKLTWVSYENLGVRGLTYLGGPTTEASCKAACEKNEACWSIDFSLDDNKCYIGYQQKPTDKVPSTNVNHHDLTRDCSAPRKYPDCGAILHADPKARSGIYSIAIPGRKSPTEVYCDMDTDGGGWTVFQRRKDGSVSFKRTWCEYANGFGNLGGEFWLGNDNIAALTNARSYTLRVDLGQYDGVSKFAEYSGFVISGEDDKYRLKYWSCSYSGNASDAFGGNDHYRVFGGRGGDHYGMKFSTDDQDNDPIPGRNCAKEANCGGWFNDCFSVNLNGVYDRNLKIWGIVWTDWDHPLKFTEMKIRSVGY